MHEARSVSQSESVCSYLCYVQVGHESHRLNSGKPYSRSHDAFRIGLEEDAPDKPQGLWAAGVSHAFQDSDDLLLRVVGDVEIVLGQS